MKRTISKTTLTLKGDQAREFFAAIMSDEDLIEQSKNDALSPEMRKAVTSQLVARDLVDGNWQI